MKNWPGMFKNSMAVCVYCQWQSPTANDFFNKYEIPLGILLLAEKSIWDGTGGIIHG
jgi:hypothetical protein